MSTTVPLRHLADEAASHWLVQETAHNIVDDTDHNKTAHVTPHSLVLVPADRRTGLEPLVLVPGKYTLGTAASCSLELPFSGIGTCHALVIAGEQLVVLKAWDRRSWLNDNLVREAELHAGDRLTLGPATFLVRQATIAELQGERPAVSSEAGFFEEQVPEPAESPRESPSSKTVTQNEQEQKSAETALQQAEARLQRLNAQIARREKERQELLRQQQKLAAELTRQRQALEETTAKAERRQALLADLQNAVQAEAVQLQERLQNENVENCRRESDLSAAEAAFRREQEEWTAERQRVEQEHRATEQRLEDRAAAIEKQFNDLQSRQDSLQQLAGELDEQQQILARQAAEQAEEVERWNNELQTRKAALASRLDSLAHLEATLSRRRQELESSRGDLDQRQKALEEEENRLSAEAHQLAEQQAELQQRSEQIAAEQSALQEDLLSREHELARQQESLQKERDRLEEEQNRLTEQARSLAAREDERQREKEREEAGAERSRDPKTEELETQKATAEEDSPTASISSCGAWYAEQATGQEDPAHHGQPLQDVTETAPEPSEEQPEAVSTDSGESASVNEDVSSDNEQVVPDHRQPEDDEDLDPTYIASYMERLLAEARGTSSSQPVARESDSREKRPQTPQNRPVSAANNAALLPTQEPEEREPSPQRPAAPRPPSPSPGESSAEGGAPAEDRPPAENRLPKDVDRDDLHSLREVANISTRSAVARAVCRRLRWTVLWKGALAGVAFSMAYVLWSGWWWDPHALSVSIWAALGTGVVTLCDLLRSILQALRGSWAPRPACDSPTQRREQKDRVEPPEADGSAS